MDRSRQVQRTASILLRMRKPSWVVIVVIVAVLIGLWLGMSGEGGSVQRWLASMHGTRAQ